MKTLRSAPKGSLVLIVSQDALFLKSASSDLQSAGCSVLTASTVIQSVRALEKNPVNIVIPDLTGLRGNGLLLIDEIRGRHQQVSIIAMSANPLLGFLAKRMGVRTFLQPTKVHGRRGRKQAQL